MRSAEYWKKNHKISEGVEVDAMTGEAKPIGYDKYVKTLSDKIDALTLRVSALEGTGKGK